MMRSKPKMHSRAKSSVSLPTLPAGVSGDYGLLPEHENMELKTPTSLQMKNSFIINTGGVKTNFDMLFK